MKLALFGGTFDPVHNGHLAVARAAAERFGLKQVLLVPSSRPPHREGRPLSPYPHRFAMLALAAQADKLLVPSDIEAPEPGATPTRPSYSLDTVRRLKKRLRRSDQLYFLIGIDAFADIAKWYKPEELLRECDFIVASRPGYSLADVGKALPQSLRPGTAVLKALGKQKAAGTIALGETTIHLLENVKVDVSATQIRQAVAGKRSFKRLVPAAVEEYIRKTGLYR